MNHSSAPQGSYPAVQSTYARSKHKLLSHTLTKGPRSYNSDLAFLLAFAASALMLLAKLDALAEALSVDFAPSDAADLAFLCASSFVPERMSRTWPSFSSAISTPLLIVSRILA